MQTTVERKERKDQGRHYRAIVAAAEQVGWPLKFRTDLTKHDRAFLAEREPSKPFSWILHEGGTHIYAPGIIDGVGHKASSRARAVAETFSQYTCRFYLWDGARLIECATADELDSRMAQIEEELGV
jgi:hypothetical protein